MGESLANRIVVEYRRAGGNRSVYRDLSALRGAVYRALSPILFVLCMDEV